MSKLLFFLFGHRTVVNATPIKFTRAATKAIRKSGWFIGHKAYITRNFEKADNFVATDESGQILFYIDFKGHDYAL